MHRCTALNLVHMPAQSMYFVRAEGQTHHLLIFCRSRNLHCFVVCSLCINLQRARQHVGYYSRRFKRPALHPPENCPSMFSSSASSSAASSVPPPDSDRARESERWQRTGACTRLSNLQKHVNFHTHLTVPYAKPPSPLDKSSRTTDCKRNTHLLAWNAVRKLERSQWRSYLARCSERGERSSESTGSLYGDRGGVAAEL